MIVSRVDPEAKSTLAAAEGFRALAAGDTVLARQKYSEAGEILLHGSKHDLQASRKHMLRFLAASQFYHGGDYQRAAKIAKTINRGHLPPSDYQCFDQFLKDIKIRTAVGYAKSVFRAIDSARQAGRYQEALRVLQHHPYVMNRAALAWNRADLCLRSERIQAAVQFSADALLFSNHHPKPVFLRAGAATFLKFTGKPAAAAEFLRLVLSKQPTPLDFMSVCIELYIKLENGQGDRSAGFELLRLADIAHQRFTTLPASTMNDAGVRLWMVYGYLLAALTADLLRGRQHAMTYIEAGEVLAPHGVPSAIFQLLRNAEHQIWIHSPDVVSQLALVFTELVTQRERQERLTFLTAA